MISVYDHDRLGRNACIGTTNIKSRYFVSRPNQMQRLALMLNLTKSDIVSKDCHVLIKGNYIPYNVIRKQFWTVLARPYLEAENQISQEGIVMMLETVGSNIAENTWRKILQRSDDKGIYRVDELADALEELTVRPKKSNSTEQENIVLIRECPICKRHWGIHSTDVDVITHLGNLEIISLGVCYETRGQKNLDALMMGGLLTEEYASRKWFMRLFSFMSFGGYSIGKNNGNIFIQDRNTGKLIEERIPTYIRLGLRMLHQNLIRTQTANYAIAKRLFKALSIRQGIKFDEPASRKLIPEFIRYHGISMKEILKPLEEFATFNEFFYRELKPGVRPIAGGGDPSIIISPADCRCNVYTEVKEATRVWIKGKNFSISGLLDDVELGMYFQDGAIMLCRLAPQDYHRFHSPIDCKIISVSTIAGQYYTVNPMAVRQNIDVLTENLRVIYLLESLLYGKVVLAAVGAMLVSSIKITKAAGAEIKKGEELGYFAFGGSTIVVVFKKGDVKFCLDLVDNSLEQLETLIKMGDRVGTFHEK